MGTVTTAPEPETTGADPQFCQDTGEAAPPRTTPAWRLALDRCSTSSQRRAGGAVATA